MTTAFTPPTGRRRVFGSAHEAQEYMVAVARHLPVLAATYFGNLLDRPLRERVMVAVSRSNACVGCTAVHQRWALRAGVTAAELVAIGSGELATLDHRNRAAIVYATALAETGFRRERDDELHSLVRSHLTDRELRAVEAVARTIALANLAVNSLHAALPSRLALGQSARR